MPCRKTTAAMPESRLALAVGTTLASLVPCCISGTAVPSPMTVADMTVADMTVADMTVADMTVAAI
jgi:hypothetical protein